MNRLVINLIVVLLIGFLSSCVKEYECDVTPVDKNNLIDDGFTSINNTSLITQLDSKTFEDLIVQNDGLEKNTYIKFNDFTKVDKQVKSATLKLYSKGTPTAISSTTYSLIISAINENWNERTLSYDNSPSTTSYSTKVFTLDTLSDKKLFEIDVTDMLNAQYKNDLPQFGFNLSLSIEGENEIAAVTFYSSDSEESTFWPTLEVTYGETVLGVPEVYYSTYKGNLTFFPSMSIYKAWYTEDSGELNTDTIRDALSADGHSPIISADFGLDSGVYWMNGMPGLGNYLFAKANGSEEGELLNFFTFEEVDSILFLDNDIDNGVYLAGTSNEGAIFIGHLSENSNKTDIIYQKEIAGETLTIADMEEAEGSYLLYWIELEEATGKFRIMRYNYLTTSVAEVFNETDFESGFVPSAFTLGNNKIYITGNTDVEKGIFYAAENITDKIITKIEVTSSFKNNITDCKLDEAGEYLYWMNYSELATEGGIMRVKVEGGTSEVAYGNIAHGYSFEIPPYAYW